MEENTASQNFAPQSSPVKTSFLGKLNHVTPFSMFLATALLIGLPVAAFFFGMYYQAQSSPVTSTLLPAVATQSATKKTATVAATPKVATSPAAQVTTGTITGHVSYPASKLPADEKVCAQDIANAKAPICIAVVQNADLSYSLSVPAGSYYVYSTADNELKGYKAYYDQFSVCGNSASCPAVGHTQYIKVVVAAGQTVTGIDPGDWYNQ